VGARPVARFPFPEEQKKAGAEIRAGFFAAVSASA